MNKQDAFEAADLILRSAGTDVLEMAVEKGVNIRENRPKQRLVNQKDASVYCGVALNTFKKAKIVICWVAGCKRYDVYDLDKYIEQNKKEDMGEGEENEAEAAATAPARIKTTTK